ncbi:MAG: hypothetical protein AB7S38_33435 [Vulcanimicrobiota bacterium]
MVYGLENLFSTTARDFNGQPLCEVYSFEDPDEGELWVEEEPQRRQLVTEDHPTIVALLSPSPVFEVDTEWTPVGDLVSS